MPTSGLFWRALTAFLALPGMVAFVVPFLLRPPNARIHSMGLVPLVLGTFLLLWCVRDFYVAGRGSLAPWAPPVRMTKLRSSSKARTGEHSRLASPLQDVDFRVKV